MKTLDEAAWDQAVGSAIEEVEAQLQRPGAAGFVWINDWATRYQPVLGRLVDFLESRPERFIVHRSGRRFLVELTERPRAPVVPATTYHDDRAAQRRRFADEVVREVLSQLLQHDSDGTVWIPDWDSKYLPVLGSLRSFLLNRSDFFDVLPGSPCRVRLRSEGAYEDDDDARERRRRPPPQRIRGEPQGTGRRAAAFDDYLEEPVVKGTAYFHHDDRRRTVDRSPETACHPPPVSLGCRKPQDRSRAAVLALPAPPVTGRRLEEGGRTVSRRQPSSGRRPRTTAVLRSARAAAGARSANVDRAVATRGRTDAVAVDSHKRRFVTFQRGRTPAKQPRLAIDHGQQQPRRRQNAARSEVSPLQRLPQPEPAKVEPPVQADFDPQEPQPCSPTAVKEDCDEEVNWEASSSGSRPDDSDLQEALQSACRILEVERQEATQPNRHQACREEPPWRQSSSSTADDWDNLVARAIDEAVKQLEWQPRGKGKVWIRSWPRDFEPMLGKQRDFLDSRPDKFIVEPTGDRSYTVALTPDCLAESSWHSKPW